MSSSTPRAEVKRTTAGVLLNILRTLTSLLPLDSRGQDDNTDKVKTGDRVKTKFIEQRGRNGRYSNAKENTFLVIKKCMNSEPQQNTKGYSACASRRSCFSNSCTPSF